MVSTLIVSAGVGERMRSSLPKPYIKIGNTPILGLTLNIFENKEEIEEIVLVVHKEWISYAKDEIVTKFNFKKVKNIVAGGDKRQDSVKAGLDFITGEFVLIHDGVRPFVEASLIDVLLREVQKYKAVIPCVNIEDTVKEVREGFVSCTLDREKLRLVQTPEAFRTSIIKKAYEEAYKSGYYGTDCASLVERMGVKVKVVKGSSYNIKITTKEDLVWAERIMKMLN